MTAQDRTPLLADQAGRLDIEARRNAQFTYEIAWTTLDDTTEAETVLDLTGYTAECNWWYRNRNNDAVLAYTATSGGTLIIDAPNGTTTFNIPTGTMRATFESRTYEYELRLIGPTGETAPDQILAGTFRIKGGKP